MLAKLAMSFVMPILMVLQYTGYREGSYMYQLVMIIAHVQAQQHIICPHQLQWERQLEKSCMWTLTLTIRPPTHTPSLTWWEMASPRVLASKMMLREVITLTSDVYTTFPLITAISSRVPFPCCLLSARPLLCCLFLQLSAIPHTR